MGLHEKEVRSAHTACCCLGVSRQQQHFRERSSLPVGVCYRCWSTSLTAKESRVQDSGSMTHSTTNHSQPTETCVESVDFVPNVISQSGCHDSSLFEDNKAVSRMVAVRLCVMLTMICFFGYVRESGWIPLCPTRSLEVHSQPSNGS